MKRFAIALTALTLTAGSVAAAPAGADNERPEAFPNRIEAAQAVTVDAGTVLTQAELDRSGLKADTQLSITDFSGEKPVDTYTR